MHEAIFRKHDDVMITELPLLRANNTIFWCFRGCYYEQAILETYGYVFINYKSRKRIIGVCFLEYYDIYKWVDMKLHLENGDIGW